MTGIEMTREDVENIALTKAGVEGLKEENKEIKSSLEDIKKMLKGQHSICMGHFDRQDERIHDLEDAKKAECIEVTVKQQIVSKTTAVIVVLAACVVFIVDHAFDIYDFLRKII
jgi:hypothetical protein